MSRGGFDDELQKAKIEPGFDTARPGPENAAPGSTT